MKFFIKIKTFIRYRLNQQTELEKIKRTFYSHKQIKRRREIYNISETLFTTLCIMSIISCIISSCFWNLTVFYSSITITFLCFIIERILTMKSASLFCYNKCPICQNELYKMRGRVRMISGSALTNYDQEMYACPKVECPIQLQKTKFNQNGKIIKEAI